MYIHGRVGIVLLLLLACCRPSFLLLLLSLFSHTWTMFHKPDHNCVVLVAKQMFVVNWIPTKHGSTCYYCVQNDCYYKFVFCHFSVISPLCYVMEHYALKLKCFVIVV